MNRTLAPTAPVVFAAVLTLSLPASAQVFSDNFDAGNDDAWTHLEPLAEFGSPGTYTFPDGTYRIQALTPTPDPELGNARAGSYVTGLSYSDFHVEVDLVTWPDFELGMDLGVLARMIDPGLGSLNGYGFTYDNNNGTFYISRLDGESPEVLIEELLFISAEENHRLVFIGRGSDFEGHVYEYPDLENPILSLQVSDSTYAAGFVGLFNAALESEFPFDTTDTTFDNFVVSPDGNTGGGPPALLEITAATLTSTELAVSFAPVSPTGNYSLQLSGDLGAWEAQPAAVYTTDGTTGTLTVPRPGSAIQFARVSATPETNG